MEVLKHDLSTGWAYGVKVDKSVPDVDQEAGWFPDTAGRETW